MLTRVALFIVLFAAALSAQQLSDPQLSEVRSVLRSASALVPMVEESQRPSVAANIAVYQVRAGDVEGALLTTTALASSGDPGLAIDSVAATLAAHGDQDLALKLVDTSPKENTKATAYLEMALALAQKKKFDLAVETANRIPDTQFPAWVDATMRVYLMEYQAGEKDSAASLLQSVVTRVKAAQDNPAIPTTIRPSLFVTIVNNLAQSGNSDAAWPIVEELRALAEEATDPQQRDSLFYYLAVVETQLGAYGAAQEAIDRLPLGNLHDGAVEVLAGVRTQKGDPDAALEQLSNQPNEFLRLTTIRSVADERAEQGNYAGALAVIESIQRPGDRAYAFAELALEQAQHEDPTTAYTNELAWETARENPDQTAPYVFGFIAETRAIVGDYSGSMNMMPDLADEWRPHALLTLTSQMSGTGHTGDAYALADAQTHPYSKAYALLGIAAGTLYQIDQQDKQPSTP